MSNNSIGPVDIEFALKNLNFQAEAEKLKQGIKGITTTAQQEASKTNNALKGGFGGIDKMLDGVGLSISGLIGPAAGVAAAFKFKQLAQEAYEFEMAYGMAMREVQTISKATQDNFEGISQSIVDLAANGPDDAITLAKAYYQIVSAGQDGAAGLELLSVASKAATAGVTDTLTAADGLTTVINAWGLSADQANSVADVMFKTVERGKTTFSQLASNIAQVAPLASANGIGLNEIFSALQTITKQGTPTAQAMTQIRSSIINMNNSLGDGWSKTMTYQDGLNKIAEMAGGSSIELKKLIPDVEGMSAVLALTGEKAKGAAEDLNETTKAAGSMETAYGRMMEEADNKWSVVHNKWTREMRELGKSMKEGSSMFADFLNDLLTNEKADIIDPGAKKIVDETVTSISTLTDKEEKLTAVIKKINELKSKRMNDILPNIDAITKQQPGWFQRSAETLNAGLGLTALTPGRYKQAELQLYNHELAITQKAEKELFDLYTKIADTPATPKVDQKVKARTLSDINKEIEEAKKNQESTTNKKEFDNIQKTIDKLEAEKTAITGVADKNKELKTEYEKLEEKIKKASAAVVNSTEKERPALQEKLAALVKEKQAWDDLIKAQRGETKGLKPLSVTAQVSTGKDQLVDQLKPMKQLTEEQRKQLEAKSKQLGQDEVAKENWEIQSQLIQEASGFLSHMTDKYAEQLGLTEQQAEQLSAIAGIIGQLASGNIAGALLMGLEQTIADTRNAELVTKAYARQLEVVNNLLVDNQRLIDQSARTGGQDEAYKQRIELLKKQEEIQKKQITANEMALDKARWEKRNSLFGALFGSTADERKALEAAQQALKETQQEIEDTQLAWNDFLRGGLTENTISDSIAQGFQQGKTSVADFADFVNSMLLDAVLSVFKAEILGPEITAMSEYVKTALLDNVLSSDEVARANEMSQEIIDKNKPLWDNLTSNLNLQGTSATSSTAIKGISASVTEDTMNAFIGMITAVRTDIKSILVNMASGQDDVAKNLLYMKEVAENSRHLPRLKAIEEGIGEMNKTLKEKL